MRIRRERFLYNNNNNSIDKYYGNFSTTVVLENNLQVLEEEAKIFSHNISQRCCCLYTLRYNLRVRLKTSFISHDVLF